MQTFTPFFRAIFSVKPGQFTVSQAIWCCQRREAAKGLAQAHVIYFISRICVFTETYTMQELKEREAEAAALKREEEELQREQWELDRMQSERRKIEEQRKKVELQRSVYERVNLIARWPRLVWLVRNGTVRRWTFRRWNVECIFLWNVTKVQKFALPLWSV